MKTSQDLRLQLRHGKTLSASWLFLGSPVTTEILSLAGFDLLLLDREHAPGGLDTLYHQLRASRVPVVVRLDGPDPSQIKLALDAGAEGIAISNLSTGDQARALIAATRYVPEGTRGIQRLSRAASYGPGWEAYRATTGAAPLTMAVIETVAGLENLDDILSVEGLDILFVGAVDLAAGLGHLDDMGHPDVQDAVRRIETRTRAAGKALGGLANAPEDAAAKQARGYQVLSFGSDALFLRDGALSAARHAKDALA
ncbi:MAG: aldolase/citrate lyase family protein [Rhodobacteraceae bacterium]|nr:aldolase/citrate lyase family protein [Paracoccaceae bacterium]